MNVSLHSYQQKEKPKGGGWLWLLLVLAGLIVLVFSGCCKKVYPAAGVTVHDTVTFTRQVRLRDTAIVVQGARTSVMIDWSKFIAHKGRTDTTTVVRNSNKQAHLKVQQVGKDIIVNCDCDTMAIEAKLKDTYTKESEAKTVIKTMVVEKKYVPFVVKILAWFGGICLLGLLAYLSKKFWLK